MSSPVLKRFTSESGKGAGQDLRFIMSELAIAGIKAVAEDLERQLRYGSIANAPISVDLSDVGFAGNDFRVVLVTAVLPISEKSTIPDDIRAAVAKVSETWEAPR